MKILKAAQMGEVDRLTTERYRIPSMLLMENAGRRCAEELVKAVPDIAEKRIVILCGRGNNGGDGFVAARWLALGGAHPEVFLFASPDALTGDARTNFLIAEAMRLPIQTLPDAAAIAALFADRNAAPEADVIVDALFGTGLARPVGPDFLPVLNWAERASARAFVMAIDIPSGLMADSPVIPGPVIKADMTVTFSALKPAHVLAPAADLAGKIVLAPIGSPDALFDNPEYRWNLAGRELVRRVLPPRPRAAHKGSFGHVYVAAGSAEKSGAAFMAASAALRSGAGLVTLFLPEGLRGSVAGKYPELMTEFLPETEAGTFARTGAERLVARLTEADALVLGPGMTTEPSTRSFIRELVERSPVPVILDADGLNAFAPLCEPFKNINGRPVALTPHPGEMARLLGKTVAEVQSRRVETALGAAERFHAWVTLKGNQTLTAAPDGELFINATGNPGMATGGSGDILAGMMGRFAAAWKLCGTEDRPGFSEYIAAAVYLHGLSGDIAAGKGSEESLVATDLLERLPAAFQKIHY
jgi:NAD(P)H-hydrate epimerase